jgi:hypothetical protein
MRYYRIKQINENTFIPQTRKWWDMWEGIESRGNSTYSTWYGSHYQLRYCVVYSLEEANQIIKEYKAYWDKIKQYPKYHVYKP